MTRFSTQTHVKSLLILQLNCHRSPSVFHSLFNNPSTSSRHVVLLQEPAVYPQSGLPMSNPLWIQFLPSLPPPLDPDSPTVTPRYRCVNYVKKSIPTHLVSQLNSLSSLVVALQIVHSPLSPPLTIINAYLPPATSLVAQSLSPSLSLVGSGPVLLGMDLNLHHPAWNPPTYTHSHPAAEDLLLLAATFHLVLRSEVGIPTFYPTSDRSANTTIDLVWTNKEAYELATTCVTDVLLEHSHSSDHAAILTMLDLPNPACPLIPQAPRLNWNKMDDPLLSTSLNLSLLPLSTTLPPAPSRVELENFIQAVTSAINLSITSHMPT